jgi:hypothetical protein
LPRWTDPQKPVGNLELGQTAFGSQETITEYGLPFSRVYDGAEELARIRGIYAREAGSPSRRRPAIAFNTNRSLRRI